ncbi:unnamed protein product [Parnassius mnemosyne]|uniref:RNA-directed DNA polymerase n=1 Tax=Parnassius mnemosyne TaxID=213953 RepID=A0AAV1KF15_9NEOP
MEHARPPVELVLEGGPAARADSWRKWRKQFEVFLKASGVANEESSVQASLLVNLIGSAGYEIYSTFTYLKDETEDDIKCLLKKFDKYFGTKPNVTLSRFKFFTRGQEEGENIDQYVTALKLLSQSCEFGNLNESLIRDRIVCGIISNIVRDRLLRTDDLTLEKAVQICQVAEISKEESSYIENSPGGREMRVDAVRDASGRSYGGVRRSRGGSRGARRGGRGRGPVFGAGSAASRTRCLSCGNGWCSTDDRCPARDALCYVCDKKGHFAKVCVHKYTLRDKVLNLNVCEPENMSDAEMFYVDMILSQDKKCKLPKEWNVIFQCNGRQVQFKLDTGSMLNVISKNDYLNLGMSIHNLKYFNKCVQSFTGNNLPILGMYELPFIYKSKHYILPFVVADLNCQNVLGLEGCVMLGLVSRVDGINIHKYSDLFEGLGKLPGQYSIVVDKNVQPVICPTRKIPLGMKDKLLAELRRMEKLGVIRKVTHPTEWVNAIVLVAKKNGDIRVCLDPRPLNRAVRRAHYSLPTVSELAARLRGATYFSVLDARSGFWMVQIDPASADLCTFGTPFGRYQFLRLPYGVNCAPEVFHAKLRQYLEDLEGVDSFIDDVIVWGNTKEQHDFRLKCLLNRAREIGIKFNKEKCKFGVREIVYLGHKFDKNGIKPDESKVKAIMGMPYPTDRKALERFMGMVNYLSKFIQNYSDSVSVLRSLLKKNSEWLWEPHHSDAIDSLKNKISSAPVLALYSTELPVVVSVDASARALGAVLLQAGRPVEFASLTLTDTQTRYAQIEKEMLAIVFAAERFKQYIYGRSDVTVQTDQSLEALFNKALSSVPIRLQRMMMRIQGYDFKVVYTPGKYMYIADTLSRAPLPEFMHDRVSEDVETQTCFMIECMPFSREKIDRVRKATEVDEECQLLIKYILNGWPKNEHNVHKNVRKFWSYCGELQYVNGLILKNYCIFIPQSLRAEMIVKVHEGHLGIERCKRRARDVMFWPGLSADVERAVRRCESCALHARAPAREPLLQHIVPNAPWQKLASDIFEYKKKYYVILVDYFSNYVEVQEVNSINSRTIIHFMKEQFSRHGIPSELVTDNGPAYSSQEFKKFLRLWEVKHMTSSPHYPQSNGKSERTVQTIKNLLKKCIDSGDDFFISLLNYRSTPRYGMDSPAQILMGRRLCTKLPISDFLLNETIDRNRNYKMLMQQRKYNKLQYDKSAKPLRTLLPGNKAILVDNGNRKPVSIIRPSQEPRSFIVQDSRGRRLRRNRRHLIVRYADSDETRPAACAPSASNAKSAELTAKAVASNPEQFDPLYSTDSKTDTEGHSPCINPPITRSKTRLMAKMKYAMKEKI